MKKCIMALFLCIGLLLSPISTLGADSPPVIAPDGIRYEINSGTARFYVTTANANGGNITVSILKMDKAPIAEIPPYSGKISSDEAWYSLNLPNNILPGSYKVKVRIEYNQKEYTYFQEFDIKPNDINRSIAPAIKLIPNSHTAGNSQQVDVSASIPVSDGTDASIVLFDSDNNAVNGVGTIITPVSGSNIQSKINIPGSIGTGIYKIRVKVLGVITDTPYIINQGTSVSTDPVIDSISTPGELIQGSIIGNLIIKGKNFSTISSNNLVEIIDSTANTKVGNSLSPVKSTADTMTVAIPTGLTAGVYKIKLTINNKSVTSNATFTVNANSTPAASGPQIERIGTSPDASLTEGSIKGKLLIALANFTSLPEDNKLHILDGSGSEKTVVSLEPSSTNLQLSSLIPTNLLSGSYKVRIIVNGKDYTSADSLNIAANQQTTTPVVTKTVTITGLDISNAVLVEGTVNGSITIAGDGFDVQPTVEVVKDNTVIKIAPVLTYNKTSITVNLPASLPQGTYKLRVNINGQVKISSNVFTITPSDRGNQNNPVIGTQNSGVITQSPAGASTSNNSSNNNSGNSSNNSNSSNNTINNNISNGTNNINQTNKSIPSFPDSPIDIKGTKTEVLKGEKKSVTQVNGVQIISNISETNNNKNKEIQIVLPPSKMDTKEVLFGTDAIGAILSTNTDVYLKSDNISLGIPKDVFINNSSSLLKLDIKTMGAKEKSTLINSLSKTSMTGMTMVSPVLDFKITAESGPVKKLISSFREPVNLQFKFTSIDTKKVDIRKLGLYYLNTKTKNWVYTGGKYNASNKTFTANTSHFSIFTVMEYKMKFDDVGSKFWAKDYIEVLAAKHIVEGVKGKNFMPGNKVTKLQLVTMLVNELNLKIEGYSGIFKDIKLSDKNSGIIGAALRAGIITGKKGDSFLPNSFITKQDMIVMIMNAYKYVTGKNEKVMAKDVKITFTDFGKVSKTAQNYVKAAQKAGIIDLKTSKILNPSNPVNRADTAQLLYRLLEAIKGL